MTERNQPRPSLSAIFRRHAARHGIDALPPAEELLQLADVAHADEAASPLCADLLRLARALEPASAQLSADVTALRDGVAPLTHRRPAVRPQRAAAAARRRGVMAAVAASVLAVVGAWTLQHRPSSAPTLTPSPLAAAPSAAPADRIFAALDNAPASAPQRDQIFGDHFASDVIFATTIGG